MTETRITNIVEPSVFKEYFLEQTVKNNSLIQSGIVVPDPKLDALALSGGTLLTMPFFQDLDGTSADEILSESSALTVNAIGTDYDKARLHVRGKAWGASDLSAAISGDDPMAAIASYVADYWAFREQALLISSLVGVFTDNTDNDSGDLIHTAAAEATADIKAWNDTSPTVMNPVAILDGAQKLGDAKSKFTALVMHSKCLTDLIKQDLIEYRKPSEGDDMIPYYLNKRVIENDNCPTRSGTGTGTPTVYKSFLFAEGAVGRGEGAAPVPVETGRNELYGYDFLVTRRHFLLHPRGFQWQESSIAGNSPTNSECEEAAQWDRVYEKKNTRCVMIETN